MHYDLTTLPNGLRVITQTMSSVRSAAIGCWVDTGSRDEIGAEHGCSHFLEHLLFKGSETMTARDISEAFDAIGAQHNAFTSKEYTCYWARMRDADLTLGIEILAEMLQRPAFRQDEIDSERHVVLEEINMNEDDPGDVAHELFVRTLWSGHTLSPPILGTKESITEMTRDTIKGYWERRYSPKSTVVAVAGNVEHAAVVDEVARRFGEWEGESIDRTVENPTIGAKVSLRHRETEQAHLVFGGPSLQRDDKRRFALTVADHVLGGGMSSRLFREIREERGLAYAVHSFRLPYVETGASAVYVGTTPYQTSEVLGLVRGELDKMMQEPLTDAELTRSKGHVKGSLALSWEDVTSNMTRIGRTELTGMEHLSVDEVVERIEAVTADDVLAVTQEAYSGPYVLGAVGPFNEGDLNEFVR